MSVQRHKGQKGTGREKVQDQPCLAATQARGHMPEVTEREKDKKV